MKGWASESLGTLIARKVRAWWNVPLEYAWPEELNRAVLEADSAFVCHHCFTPQGHPGWFCPECGFATGPYNNCMPFLYIFSTGEVVRAGVGSRLKWSVFNTGFLILYSFAEYLIFAPIYWFRMYRNWKRQTAGKRAEE